MALIVKKFGGSSVATPEKMIHIVEKILREKKSDDQIIIVVSAMGDTTDRLLSLAKDVTSKPYGREMDMLLSTGEQMSIALMAMAFKERGHKAISLTGQQAGIKTTNCYNKGRILNISSYRITEALDEGNIVIVAGFQGCMENGDIVTLGRGGSDTTAVALAGALQADACEIFTDVEGVFSSDPRIVDSVKKIEEITYQEMLELARLGAGVMQTRAVEVGHNLHVPIHVRSTFSDKPGTLIKNPEAEDCREQSIVGVAADSNVVKISLLDIANIPDIAHQIFKVLDKEQVVVDMIVQSNPLTEQNSSHIILTICADDLSHSQLAFDRLLTSGLVGKVKVDVDVAKVAIVGMGILGKPGIAQTMFGAIGAENINIDVISATEISITCLVKREFMKKATCAVHAAFIK